ncbi:MAG: hydrogenase maturation nickel metallochaperone HypA [Candidatus Bipolaricaulota bacterium]|nr:hydrogenase maturation nickel metallochaperone HypA [Candidatus Bipolaricaulota bacterium]MBS3791661.1 hydrogenase maturation nickel metallochaperone HypA [Candidatus Bipolaricaulota bacterium]
MHEYSIARELIDTLTDQVDEDRLTRTKKIHLELGELRVISKEALSQAFKIVTEDTILNGAELEFEEASLVARCQECGFEGEVNYDDDLSLHFSVPVLSCPDCGSSVDIVRGNELSVKSLTVEDSDSDD